MWVDVLLGPSGYQYQAHHGSHVTWGVESPYEWRESHKWSFLLLQVNIFISFIKSPNLGLTEISRVRKMHSVLGPLLWSAILIKECYKIVSRFYLNNFHKSSNVVCFSRNGWNCWCYSWKLLCILHFLFQSCICIVCNSLAIQEF